MGRQVWRWLTSVRLALVLIAILTLMSGVGASVNTEVFYSTQFLLVSILFIINTACCTWDQVQRAWSRSGRAPDPGTCRNWIPLDADTGVGRAADAAAALLGSRRYAVSTRIGADGAEVTGRRFFFAVWGSPVFHVGLVLIMLGGFASLSMRTRGMFAVGEGKIFQDRPDQYVSVARGKLVREKRDRFALQVDEVKLHVNERNEMQDLAASVHIFREGKEVAAGLLDSAKPLNAAGMAFYQNRFGYSPALILQGADGREVSRFVVAMDTVAPEQSADTDLKEPELELKATFTLPGTTYEALGRFFPTQGGTDDAPTLKDMAPANPALWLQIYQGERAVYKGLIRPGQSARFDGHVLNFDHLRRWYGVTVVDDPGIFWVYTGFLLVLIGLLGMYLFIPREIAVRIHPAEAGGGVLLEVGGRMERFPAIFKEELESVALALKTNLEDEVDGDVKVGDRASLVGRRVLRS